MKSRTADVVGYVTGALSMAAVVHADIKYYLVAIGAAFLYGISLTFLDRVWR